MGKLDQLVKSVFLRETPSIAGDSLVFSVPPETPTTEVHADGLLTVVRPTVVAGLPGPWRLAREPEVVLEFKMQGDKVDRFEVERGRLRRQARQARRARDAPTDARLVSLWFVSGYVPPWVRDEYPLEEVERGVYVLPHEPTSWVASNALPLELELLPFLVTRTGRHLIELLTWLLDIRPELCKELIEVVPMSAAEYEAYEEQVEAITEEEHQRLLTEFLTRMATKRGILEAARAAGELAGQRQSVLEVLALRGLSLTEPERARILAEADPERLRRWLTRAVAVDTAAQVFADE